MEGLLTVKILEHYQINERTMAIIPANQLNYQSIVIEAEVKLYIKKTPFEIIKRGCLENFSSYEGRRDAVTHLTGYKRKVPIPISVHRNIFVFPTHAVKDLDCCWIFYHHVESIVEQKPNIKQSVILFKDGSEFIVNVSKSELLKQLERTTFLLSLVR
ncbi:competence protein ComK [Ornithinibacillus halotolerans]|uniref:Competence protein ComK n=1 Tax=Ornithinibacillus halotolerans TaxID=1274357 RepID=A0A916WDV6_9BACI|nr:competence protein ComK [Ornithinibacillus halotolerans]GGA91609.1 hypothetical protein GCM10008025_37630 [Ornithinibacillus halotolerans]